MLSITVTSGNLFQIAANYLGDATMWIYIAELNGLGDPFIYTMTQLQIPAATNLTGGGVALQ
jgi:hypothetical protein